MIMIGIKNEDVWMIFARQKKLKALTKGTSGNTMMEISLFCGPC